ncbi:MAG TPA: hypothetical protein VE398_24780 [Acidobacteriota bacterium]|nr:hypothetical protein [Acidobacteriota bacterium]
MRLGQRGYSVREVRNGYNPDAAESDFDRDTDSDPDRDTIPGVRP